MSATSDITLNLVEAQTPGSTPNLRAAVLFEVVSEFCRDVLQKVPPSDFMGNPGTWLLDTEWIEYHTTLISGVLARMHAMPNKPWTNGPVAQAHAVLYANGFARARALSASTEQATSSLNRIKSTVLVYIPGLRDVMFYQALFPVVDAVARDIVQTTPPVQTQPAESWLSEKNYSDNLTLIIDGVLASLYAQNGQVWYDIEAAKLHAAMWMAAAPRCRERAASTGPAATAYERLMVNLRTLIPDARDALLLEEVFNTIEELQRNVRQKAVPSYVALPAQWLTDDEYRTYFQLILSGTLSRIYGQPGKPWTDPKGEIARRASYEQAVVVARSDAQAEDAANPTDRLLSGLRAQLPGIKDTAIYPELFNVVDEACRQYFIWVETVQIRLTPGRHSFKIAPQGCDIVRVASVQHLTITDGFHFDLDAGTLNIHQEITEEAAVEPVIVRMFLAPLITSKSESAGEWIPLDLWGRFHQMLLTGCLHKLMLQPAKPWTDAKLGAIHGQVYRRLLNQAMYEARSVGIIPKRQSWIFPRWTQ